MLKKICWRISEKAPNGYTLFLVVGVLFLVSATILVATGGASSPQSHIAISFAGTGVGDVVTAGRGVQAGICYAGGSGCRTDVYDSLESVLITASAQPGSDFAGWSGDLAKGCGIQTSCWANILNKNARTVSLIATFERRTK